MLTDELKSKMFNWLCDELEDGFEPDFEDFCYKFNLDDTKEMYELFKEFYNDAEDVLRYDVDFFDIIQKTS